MMKSTGDNLQDWKNTSLRSLKSEKQTREEELRRLHALESDILHCLEGGERLTVIQTYYHAKALKKVLRIRRCLKRRLVVVEEMIVELEKEGATLDKALQLGLRREKEMEGNVLKNYRPRYLKTTNYKDKERNIAKDVDEALKRIRVDAYEDEYYREF